MFLVAYASSLPPHIVYFVVMLKLRVNQYKHIFWDWLWTVYDNDKQELYPWAQKVFEDSADSKHYMVSWAADPAGRKQLIEDSVLMGKLTDLWTGQEYKKGVFEQLMKKYQIPAEDILVIGDNMENEIQSAKELGLDHVHISDFVKEYGLSVAE